MSGFTSLELAHKAYLIDDSRTIQGNDVVVAGGQTTDYPASGGKRLAPGTVVVKESGDGLYYLADGADGASAGDINTAAVVTSIEAPDADWKDKTLTWTVFPGTGAPISGTVVAAGADDDTIAEWVALLNADPAFVALLTASDSGGDDFLVITSKQKGDVRIRVSIDLDTAFATDDGATSSDEASGTEADVRVVTQHRDLIDISGASFNSHPVATLMAGRFDESELSNLSNEAKEILRGRGSIFE
jgi:hypothetical protein